MKLDTLAPKIRNIITGNCNRIAVLSIQVRFAPNLFAPTQSRFAPKKS